ncbi:ABC transporter permease [Christensenellaceae bacterium OttesenSCG-928-M15]|nr:ABC transporter permease [Christensenellaceae bacterium OttesenSCG-928-M15]
MENTKSRGKFQEMWLRLKKDKLAVISLCVILVLVLCAVFAGLIFNYDRDAIMQDVPNRLKGPSSEHWFGTDELGRDIFARVIFGARTSLSIGVVSVFFSIGIAIIIGAVSGYFGGVVDNVIMRITDVFLAMPGTLLVISLVAAFGTSIVNLILATVIAYMPGYVRIVRATVMTVKTNAYIEAAKALGGNSAQIIVKHCILNSMAPIIVQATLGISTIIIATAALSYMGLGAQPPIPEWGAMLASGQASFRTSPHVMLFPAFFIFITSLCFNLLGDGLRDALDPKLKD